MRLRGGKLAGKGAYGCGYFPALRCEGESERTPGMFSKLMDSHEARLEFDIGQRWFKPADPNSDYFLYPIKMCKLNHKVLPNPENNIDSCEDRFDSLEEASVLQYRNGGSDILDIPLKPEDYLPFFAGLKNLFDGLSKLHKKNIAHMDIKLPNIVGIKDSPRSFHLRFIDFGLAMNLNEKRYPISDGRYATDYFAWPFDVRFLYRYFNEDKIQEKRIDEYLSYALHYQSLIPFEVFYEPDKTVKLNEGMMYTIYSQFLDLSDKQKIEIIAKEADVYSFGQVLSILYATKIGHFYRQGFKMCLNPKNPKTKVPLDTLKTIVSPDIYSWHEEVFEKISIPIYELVKRMMDLNVFTRITIDNARADFISVLPEMARLFKPELIRKGLSIYDPSITAVPPSPSTPTLTPAPYPLSPLNKNVSLRRMNGRRRLILSANSAEFIPGSKHF